MKNNIHRRNIDYKNHISNTDRKRTLGVAIDPSKNFHWVIIFDFTGKILVPPFSIDVLKSGYKLLKDTINKVSKNLSAKDVYIAIEQSSNYTDALTAHLNKSYKNIFYIPPNSVGLNRHQRSLHGLKTDHIDAGAIADLLIRGEFSEYNSHSKIYIKLKELVHWRLKKNKEIVSLKNQISSRFDKIYPGLNTHSSELKKLYSYKRTSILYNSILKTLKTPHSLLYMSDKAVSKIMRSKTNRRALKGSRLLKLRLKNMLMPNEEYCKFELTLLKKDIHLLKELESQIQEVEKQIIFLGKKTPAKFLMGQIGGLTEYNASALIGLIGDIQCFSKFSKLYSRTGLCPNVSQSGTTVKKKARITRAGNILLRTYLFSITNNIMLAEPVFRAYYERKRTNGKHWKVARIATAHKLLKVLFNMMKTGAHFNEVKLKPLEPCVNK